MGRTVQASYVGYTSFALKFWVSNSTKWNVFVSIQPKTASQTKAIKKNNDTMNKKKEREKNDTSNEIIFLFAGLSFVRTFVCSSLFFCISPNFDEWFLEKNKAPGNIYLNNRDKACYILLCSKIDRLFHLPLSSSFHCLLLESGVCAIYRHQAHL